MRKLKLSNFRWGLASFALMAWLGSCLIAHAQQVPVEPLPVTHGKTLSGEAITFPQPDHAQTLIIAGFSENSSVAVKAWWEQAKSLCDAHAQVACYRVAVLEDVPGFIRGMVLGGMKRDMPQAEQGSFVTVFENESAWKRILAFNIAGDAYLGLFGKDGKLLWRASGGEKAASSTALLPAFDAVRR
jgi:hypothetical protein